ncbi:EXPERA domain-containing protein [Herbiconiux sp. UC225_62]|uniref:EXPERA domain-containing protein n=1 Tax=Herbiconiux sp. UC225_62 TaxID=3350168 RepID=UPI0036D4156E
MSAQSTPEPAPEPAVTAASAPLPTLEVTIDARGATAPKPVNLPLRQRPFDIAFAVIFLLFTVTSGISDLVPTIGIPITADSTNGLAQSNYWYGHDADPLFIDPPIWMRFVTGLSAFVYGPFYLLLAFCLLTGRNWIQLPAVIYASAISMITGVVVFGVEFFGEPEFQTQNPVKFLAFNLPYVIIPILLLIRMRKPLPFTRKW